jgi:hypothetical protein
MKNLNLPPAEYARDAEVDALSAGDCGFIAARLADRHPEVFDELLRDLRNWPSSPAELNEETAR